MRAAATIGIMGLFLGSCFLGQIGDNGIRVRGNLTGETEAAGCVLELWRAGESFPYQKLPVTARFDRSFLISPEARVYSLVIRCGQEPVWADDNTGVVLRTSPFLVKDNRYYREPIDLGDLPVPSPAR